MTCVRIPYNNRFRFTENVALRKSTWQLHPISDLKVSSDFAVDGRKSNLSLKGGECTASVYSKTTAEWRVDLGKVLSIHNIFIQYATKNQERGERRFDPVFKLDCT